jgi:hypothetical protein
MQSIYFFLYILMSCNFASRFLAVIVILRYNKLCSPIFREAREDELGE